MRRFATLGLCMALIAGPMRTFLAAHPAARVYRLGQDVYARAADDAGHLRPVWEGAAYGLSVGSWGFRCVLAVVSHLTISRGR